ncbi:MAG: helix-turn-helix domain-containing protein [Synergistaceae bacterium]|jgi:AraC-like DNA-binding protein|nr:helix-turn-helix domain-containing protein [Synergistaceae bacterium]
MIGYMSVKETAARWGISQRRVQKLCEGGKIAEAMRIGRTWCVPQNTKKPFDGRAKKNANDMICYYTEKRIYTDLLELGAKTLSRNESCMLCQIENDTGNGVLTMYHISPGIKLLYSDMHMSEFKGHAIRSFAGAENVMEISYCLEGRFEVELQDGEHTYISEGDMMVALMSCVLRSSFFPLSRYHGISIFVDIPLASKIIEKISDTLGELKIDLAAVKKKFCKARPFFITQCVDSLKRLFSDLYEARDIVKESYIKLKVMELMLYLDTMEVSVTEEHRRYFYRTQIDKVKGIRNHIIAHMEEQFTQDELSRQFDIPLTSMKSCFKSIFGASIHNYIREYRLQAAAAMLRETDSSVADISARVGYETHAKFSAAFKSRMGLVPSEYRKVSVQKE